ncbi:MAG: carboxylesterase family protein [Chloroflexota bacterium]|nr:carboxylesterase family protein [Chloroflexota bacterium]MDE2894700.1 carboxylesterase family protein [Chloroflexota bacterium]
MPSIAQTTTGRIQGAIEGDLAVFRGVPYAAPPIKDLRFRAPQPHPGWDGVRDATELAPIAPQAGMDALDALLPSPPQPQSEDCLYLNLWTPALDAASRPVMLWIHGGAFTLGSGSEPLYSGANLARRGDVVVVTINYRLGALGFLHEPALGQANFGMRDMIVALRWVQDNIANFGGDPGNVTIFGESAGGAAVACLLVSPEAQGLFHRAIGMSTAGDHGILFDGTQPTTDQFYAQLGLDQQSAEQLRSLPLDDLIAAQAAVEAAAFEDLNEMWSVRLPFGPTIDGSLLTEPPLATAAAASADRGTPFLSGNPDEEMKLIRAMMPPEVLSRDDVMLRLAAIPGGADRVYAAYRNARADRGEPAAPDDIFDAVASDFLEIMPSLRFADAWARGGAPTFSYMLDWKSPMNDGALGSCHALDIPFSFGTYRDAPDFAGTGPEADALADAMLDIWTTFARTGNPAIEGLDWPPYNADSRPQMMLGPNLRVETAWRATERAVWDGVF